MGEHKHKNVERDYRHEKREGKHTADRARLTREQPNVTKSAEYDPVFPTRSEFEVNEGGPKGSTRKHPGLIWGIIAIAAIAVLVIAFVVAGDWFTPSQAEQESQVRYEIQEGRADVGAND